MKKLVLLFLFLFLCVACPAWSLTYMAHEEWGGEWYDADKSGGDSQMCWAASASNVLAYTGWGAGLDADEIMGVYRDNFPNTGGYFESALSYWINSDDLRRISTGGGGYHPGVEYADIMAESSFKTADIVSDINSWLTAGDGVYLAIEGNGTGHALTVYGLEYDASGYTGLWVADGNDGTDRLAYLSIHQQYWGTFQKDVWYVDGGAYDGWFLNNASGLMRNSTAPVPEPRTVLLLFAGLPFIRKFTGSQR